MRVPQLALLSILLAAVASPARSQDRQWITMSSDAGAEVMYGTPESDDIVFAIRCDAETKEIFVGYAHEPVLARRGDAVDLVLKTKAGEAKIPAVVSYLDFMDVTLIESVDAAGSGLRAILTGGDTLSVSVEGAVEEIPLAGTAKSFGELFEACGE